MKLTHPDSKQTVEVSPDMAGIYLSQGWVKPAPKKTTATRASGKSDTPSRTTTEKE